MGKWCEVHCNCDNRRPVPEGRWPNYESYRRNIGSKAKSFEFWEANIRNFYECGHRSGIYYETWPGDIIRIGNALAAAFRDGQPEFPIFSKIADFSRYKDEVLELSSIEVQRWAMEVGRLIEIAAGRQYFQYHDQQRFVQVLSGDPFLYGDLMATLKECEVLIDACRQTGNGIKFSL